MRSFFYVFLLAVIVALLLPGCATKQKTASDEFWVYVGTYTAGESEGIYIYKLILVSGELVPHAKATGIDNPSFLAIHPSGNYLYSVSEGRAPQGSISAFRIDRSAGKLTFLNKQSSGGAGPCHLIVDRSGKWVLAANYSGGTVSVLPILEDGRLGSATDVKQHEGSSINPDRQREPHPHSIWPSPDNRFIFVPDLGIDKIMIYRFDAEHGRLTAGDPAFFQTKPGAGPRHFTFHPSGKFAFVINELNSTITSMKYDSQTGALTRIETVSTLPKDFAGVNYCADIHTSRDGKFVYGSNRGHNSIAVFAFDERTGHLDFVETESTRGDWPRNFAIDPTGRLLLAANQKSDNVVTFWIDRETGELMPTGFQAEIPMPVCLKLQDMR